VGRTLSPLAAIGFALTTVLLLVNAGLSWWNVQRLVDAQNRLLHTHDVLTAIAGVESSVTEAERGQRNFVITGNEEHFSHYEDAASRASSQLRELRDLVADNAGQLHRMTMLKGRMEAKLAELRGTADAWRNGGMTAAQADIAGTLVRRDLDAMRKVIDAMRGEEENQLHRRTQESERNYYVAIGSGVGTGFFGIVMIWLVSRIVRRNALAHQRIAELIAEERERFRVTLNSIGDAVIVTDHEARVTFLNEIARSLIGVDGAEGQPLMDVVNVVDELTGDAVDDLFEQALRGDPARSGIDTLLLYGKGGQVPVDHGGAPVRDDRGEVIGAVFVFRDITNRRKSEADLRRADAAKDEFLAMLSHELRSPLSAVRNAISVAGLDEGSRDRALEIARRQTGRLTRIVDDLLDVARITQRKIQLRRERILLTPVLQRAIESARVLVEDRGQVLAISYPPTPIELEADPVRLEQVIDNLFTNAIKYTQPGGRIELVAERDGGDAVIRVRDNGMGMSPELVPRVFDLFAQADRSLERAEGGLGIGLTIVKLIVERHGGSVEARSEGIGKGAEFIVRMPALEPVREAEVQPLLPVDSRRRGRVLVVEDNLDAADALTMLLQIMGFETDVAHDGLEAIERARAERYALIFIDIGLPGMDGYEVARRLKGIETRKSTLIVALTGYGREEDKARALGAGFDVHLVKPVEMETLEQLLSRLEQPEPTSEAV